MKLSVDGTRALVFCVVFIGVVVLIALGKLDAEYLKYLLAWLVPGPVDMAKPNRSGRAEGPSGEVE